MFGTPYSKAVKSNPNMQELTTKQDGTDIEIIDNSGVVGSWNHAGSMNARDQHRDQAKQLVVKYRKLALTDEVDRAINYIVQDMITIEDGVDPIELLLDDVEVADNIKDKVIEEFKNLLRIMDFRQKAHAYVRSWYIDGKIFFHKVVDTKKPKQGIKKIKHIDSLLIHKEKLVHKKTDPATGVNLVDSEDPYYVYSDFYNATTEVRIHEDSIAFAHSNLYMYQGDPSKPFDKKIISYLHKAIKPINNLKELENSLVIYRLARASERRIFYTDVSGMPRNKAEQYIQKVAAQYKNKLKYNAETGEVTNEKGFHSMQEDYFMPRRDGKMTEITTLEGASSLSDIDDVEYFQKKTYKALNVPMTRMNPEDQYSIGRSSELTRDEVNFGKFVDKLRLHFNDVFIDLLKTQLILKGIIKEKEWILYFKNSIEFRYLQSSYIAELKRLEMMGEQLNVLRDLDEFTGVGKYYSKEYVQKTLLKQSEEDIKEIEKQNEAYEKKFPKSEEEDY